MSAPALFDYIGDLSHGKTNLLKQNPENESGVNQFMINRAFALGADTVLYANEMNKAVGISNRMFYDFYLISLRPRKRFNKWPKKAKIDYLEDVQKKFNFSLRKAQDALRILSMEDLEQIRKSLDEGGRIK